MNNLMKTALLVALMASALFGQTGSLLVEVFLENNDPARGVGYFIPTSKAAPFPVVDGDTINLVPESSPGGACKSLFPGVMGSSHIVNADSLLVSGLRGVVEVPYQCTDKSGNVGKGSAWINVFPPVAQNTMVALAVESAASLQLGLVDGQPIAPYELVSIFGDGFTNSLPVTAIGFPLPTQLNGITVMVGGVMAPLLYVSRTQINFQVPDLLVGSKVKLQVLSAGKSIADSQVAIVKHESELFRYQSVAIAQFVTAGPNGVPVYNLNTYNNPAVPYDSSSYIIIWYGTGMGAPTPFRADALPGMAAPSSPPATKFGGARLIAFVNNTQLPDGAVKFVGTTAGLAGLDQVNISIPTAIMNGAAKATGGAVGLAVLYQENGSQDFVGTGVVYVHQ